MCSKPWILILQKSNSLQLLGGCAPRPPASEIHYWFQPPPSKHPRSAPGTNSTTHNNYPLQNYHTYISISQPHFACSYLIVFFVALVVIRFIIPIFLLYLYTLFYMYVYDTNYMITYFHPCNGNKLLNSQFHCHHTVITSLKHLNNFVWPFHQNKFKDTLKYVCTLCPANATTA